MRFVYSGFLQPVSIPECVCYMPGRILLFIHRSYYRNSLCHRNSGGCWYVSVYPMQRRMGRVYSRTVCVYTLHRRQILIRNQHYHMHIMWCRHIR